VRHAAQSFIDFDAIDGVLLPSLSNPLSCGHCTGRASIIVSGRALCIDCFLSRLVPPAQGATREGFE